jgi:hypothetical protein
MRKIVAIFLTPLFAAGLFAQGRGGGFGRGPGGPGPGPEILGVGPGRAVVTGEPYSGTETTTRQQVLANGNTITQTTTISVARDSQGRISTSRIVTPPASSGKSAYTLQTIFDPVSGYAYRLNSSTLTAIQTPLPKPPTGTPPARPPRPSNPPSNPNAVTTSLGTQNINGVNATGTQVTVTIPAGTIGNAQPIQSVRTTWISTALQVPVEIKTSDPRFGNTDLELTNISQAEPNAALFTVPSNYTIQQVGRGGGGRARGGPGPGPNNFRRGGPPPQ